MARLPQPGGDNGNWGNILNEYLSQVHKNDGTLKDNSVANAALASDAVTSTKLQDGSILEAKLSTSVQTKLNQTAPVTSVAGKNGIVTLNKGDVNLNNVDNTSDLNKPVSSAQQTALDAKVPLVDPADSGNVSGAAVFKNATSSWYGESYNIGNVPSSFGFSGSPSVTPATSITSGVTFPLTNATIPVADCAQLDANGGSFTLGGKRVVYTGRSASSGAGNAIGCYSLSTETGTVSSGTALGNTAMGYFATTIYQRYGYNGRPNPGSTQAFGVVASYKSPTVDDSAEAGSFVTVMADPGSSTSQHKTVTGGEMTAQLNGNWRMPDGYPAALTGGGFRTAMTSTDEAKNVIGSKLSHIAGGLMQQYDGLYQTASTLQTFGTLNGSATLPQATIPVTGTFPTASATSPATVLIGANAQGVGGQVVTYTGQSGGSLTGCTGGTGTFASGTAIVNDVRGINVRDRVLSAAGFVAGTSGWTGTIIAATKGGTDGSNSMVAITGPSNAEVTGGLTQLRLNAGSGQTKQILQAYDTSGSNRLSITAAAQMILNGSAIQMQQTGVNSARFDSTGFIQPGVSTTAGAGATAVGAKIYSGSGSPSNLVGVLGDIYFRTDTPTTANQRIYICTVAGAVGAATWTGIV